MTTEQECAPVVPNELREAAQAVLDRWDSPNWKDLPATADYIARLRNALAAAPQAPGALTPEGRRYAVANPLPVNAAGVSR